MTETPLTISLWAIDTFGERTALQRASRMFMETGELLSAVAYGRGEETRREAADVVITAVQLAPDIQVLEYLSHPLRHDIFCPEARVRGVAQIVGELLETAILKPDATPIWYRKEVGRLLRALDALCEGHLWEYVEEKMGVNRARTWSETATGHHQHT